MRSLPLITESVQTTERSQLIDVTARIQQMVSAEEVSEGLVIIAVPHTTAAVTINENADPDVQHDLLRKLDQLIPRRESFYQHAEGNSDSHVKTSLVGNSVLVVVEEGRLALGTWQAIYFCEFDGPRRRQLTVKLVDLTPASSPPTE